MWIARIKISRLLMAGAAMVMAAGCDQSPPHKPIVLNPTTRPASVQITPLAQTAPTPKGPTTDEAVAAKKKLSYILINGVWVEFPEAKLILRKEGDHVTAFLSSNDPPEVIRPTYQGNRYYFELRLDTVDDVKNLAQAEFRYRAASAEPADSPNGIFLDGDKQHLQPYDIQVVFDRDGDRKMIADIRGQFLVFPKGQIVGQMLPVTATLSAKAELK